MRMFISWSGTLSHEIAILIKEWLPDVIQNIEPFVSSEDIYKGNRWSNEIAQQLNDCQYGIVCMTSYNLNAPWLLFESGALSKYLGESMLWTLLIGDLKPSDIEGPLSQFQHTSLKKEDFKKLLITINETIETDRLDKERLLRIFERCWDEFEKRAIEIVNNHSSDTNVVESRTERELLEELLELSRNQSRVEIQEKDSKDSSSKLVQTLYTIPYDAKYQFINDKILLIDNPRKKIKIPPTFFQWDKFTLAFWVNITSQFFESKNNRYLFSHTSDPSSAVDHKYPNAFFIGIIGNSLNWRFVVKGSDPQNAFQYNFSSNEALKGWKFFSIRWTKTSQRLKFDVDAGKTLSSKHKIPEEKWPTYNQDYLFHLGGWQDTWHGGLSLLEFYNFRVFSQDITDGELDDIYSAEKHLLSKYS